jgi:Fe-S cluster assembly scaffold protein SufB
LASLFPSPALVKRWQQQYNTISTAQESACTQYAEQLLESSKSINKVCTTVLSWDHYKLNTSMHQDDYTQVLHNTQYTALPGKNTLTALLAQALCPQISIIRVPAGSMAKLDLASFTAEPSDRHAELYVERMRMYIEPEAQVTLLLGNTVMAHTALIKSCDIILGAYAQVTAVVDDTVDALAHGCTHISWHLEKHARLAVMHSNTGGGAGVTQVQYFLREQRASVHHVSLYACARDNQAVLSTEQHHYASHTTSSVQVKQVVRDTARVFYEGLITLDKQANESAAEQEHAALLVSPYARASAIPALEIHNKEVRCRHASALGAIIPEYLWALQLRGLEYDQAQELIIEGFLSSNSTSSYVLDRGIYKRLVMYR